jgi:hypothetical protein
MTSQINYIPVKAWRMTHICQEISTPICFSIHVSNWSLPVRMLKEINNFTKERREISIISMSRGNHVDNDLWVHFKNNIWQWHIMSYPNSNSKSPHFGLNSIARSYFTIEPFYKNSMLITNQTTTSSTARYSIKRSIHINLMSSV